MPGKELVVLVPALKAVAPVVPVVETSGGSAAVPELVNTGSAGLERGYRVPESGVVAAAYQENPQNSPSPGLACIATDCRPSSRRPAV